MSRIVYLAVLLTALWSLPLAAAHDYYVADGQGETCNNNAAGTQNAPWCAAPGMLGWSGSATLQPGDKVYFESTGLWEYHDLGKNSTVFQIVHVAPGVSYIGNVWPTAATDCKAESCATIRNHNASNLRTWFHMDRDDASFETAVVGFELDGTDTSCGNTVSINGRNGDYNVGHMVQKTKRVGHMYIHHLRTEPYCKGAGAFSYGVNVSSGHYGRDPQGNSGYNVANVIVEWSIFERLQRNGVVAYPANDSLHANNYVENMVVRHNQFLDIGGALDRYNATAMNAKNWVKSFTAEWNYIRNSWRNGIALNTEQPTHKSCEMCIIRHNIIDGSQNHGIFIASHGDKNMAIYGNIITRTLYVGINVRQDTVDGLNLWIYNNTVPNGSITLSMADVDTLEVINNIAGTISDASGKGTLRHNNLGVACLRDPSDLPTGFEGKPGTDRRPNTEGLNLVAGSTCVDGGEVLGEEVQTSINSVLRPVCGGPIEPPPVEPPPGTCPPGCLPTGTVQMFARAACDPWDIGAYAQDKAGTVSVHPRVLRRRGF